MQSREITTPCFEGQVNESRKAIIISAPAKINLFLKVTGKRPDGYHNIYSWFQAIDLADHLEIELQDDAGIEISTNLDDLPTGEDNLVFKAARLIQDRSGVNAGFRVKLWKNIPVAAGLGGGSSDAAAFIKAADKLLNLGLSRAEMAEIGLEIGSDVPFFFSHGQAEVTGKGEKVKDITLPTDYYIGLAIPPFHISAGEAYRKLKMDLTGLNSSVSLRRCQQTGKLFGSIAAMANDLEMALLESYPILDKIKEELIKTGADIVRLTGSGPTVFALYRDKGLVRKELARSFERRGWGFKIAKPAILPIKMIGK